MGKLRKVELLQEPAKRRSNSKTTSSGASKAPEIVQVKKIKPEQRRTESPSASSTVYSSDGAFFPKRNPYEGITTRRPNPLENVPYSDPLTRAFSQRTGWRDPKAQALYDLAERVQAQKDQGNRKNFAANDPIGQMGRGNIDLYNRPQYRQPDGSLSTVNSISIGTDEGEVLIPTIGRDAKGNPVQWTDDEAIANYYRTGEHLGKFKTPEEANRYAEMLHNQQEAYYRTPEQQKLTPASVFRSGPLADAVRGPRSRSVEAEYTAPQYKSDPEAGKYIEQSIRSAQNPFVKHISSHIDPADGSVVFDGPTGGKDNWMKEYNVQQNLGSDEFRNSQREINSRIAAGQDYGRTDYEMSVFNNMTTDEQKEYSYRLGKYGRNEADKYLQMVGERVSNRRAAEIVEGVNRDIVPEANGVPTSYIDPDTGETVTLGGSPINAAGRVLKRGKLAAQSGLDMFRTGVGDRFTNYVTGRDRITPASPEARASQQVKEGLTGPGRVAYDVVENAAMMLPTTAAAVAASIAMPEAAPAIIQAGAPNSLAAAAAARIAADAPQIFSVGATMFPMSAGQAYEEALQKGLSPNQARLFATAEGLNQAAGEYLLGGFEDISGGFAKQAVDRVLGDVASDATKSATQQTVARAIQHFLTTPEGRMAFSMGSEAFEEIVQGSVSNALGNVAFGENNAPISQEDLYSGLVASLSAGLSNARYYATGYANGAGRVYSAEDIRAAANNIVTDRAAYQNQAAYDAAMEQRDQMLRQADYVEQGGRLTPLEKNELSEAAGGELGEMDRIGRQVKTGRDMQDINDAIKTAQEIAQTDETRARADEISVRAADIAKRRAEGKQVTDAEVGRLVNDTIRATMAAGNERAAAAAEARSRIGFGEQGASVIESSKASGQKLEAMTAAYEEARYNIPRNDAQKQLASSLLSEQEFSAAYQAGIQDRNAFYNNDYSKKIGKIAEKYRPGNMKRGNVTYDGVDIKALETAGDKDSRTKYAQMKTIEHFLSGTLGYNVEWFESKTEDGRYTGENGSYTRSKHLIRLDVNAGADVIGDKVKFASVISHELTHTIEDGSPVQYQKLADSVMKMLVADQEYSQGRNAEQIVADMIENNPYVSNEADAIHELVAQACEDMMNGNADVRAMFDGMSEAEQKTIFDHIKSIFAAIKNFFDEMLNSESVRSNRTEAAAIRRAKENIEALQKEWTEGVKQAAAYNAAAYEESRRQTAEQIEQNEQMENAFGDDTGRLTKDADGNVVIAESKDGSKIAYSIKTLPTTQEKLAAVLKRKGYSEESIKAAQNQVQTVADMLTRVSVYYAEMAEALDAELLVDPKTGKTVLHSFVTNGDYPVNIDFLTICKKREAYMHVLTDLIEHGIFDKVAFNGAAIATTNEILRDSGFETACACCFVESRRLQIQRWAETFCSEWNEEVLKRNPNATPFNFSKGERGANDLTQDELIELENELRSVTRKEKNPKGNIKLPNKGARANMGPLLDRIPALAHTLSVGDLITPNGIDSLRATDGNLFSLVKQRYGTATPKITQSFSPYNGDVADLNYGFMRTEIHESIPGSKKYKADARRELAREGIKKPTAQQVEDRALRKYLYDIGGVRLQSFSDFLVENTLDYFQMFADLAAKELPLHAYSKEISFIKMFGMTGGKMNMSLIPVVDLATDKEHAGLKKNKDGTYSYAGWGDYEHHLMIDNRSFIQSIGFKDAIALQLHPGYSSHIGTIAIGISDAHIRKMLNDPLIRMVIPYHSSGMLPEFAKQMHIDYYHDYTTTQNTTLGRCTDMSGNEVETYNLKGNDSYKCDTHYDFNEAFQRLGDAREACEEYKAWCKERHPVYKGSTQVGWAEFTPKFAEFANERNYYKLIEDFNSYDCITEKAAVQGAVTMSFPGMEQNLLNDEELKAYEERLRTTGQFTEKEIQKYVSRANETLEEIVTREAKNRNAYHREMDKKYDSTLNKIEAALQRDYNKADYDLVNNKYVRRDGEQMSARDSATRAGSAGEQFAMRESAEETKNLIAVHNLTEQKMKGLIKLSGFPAPSIAITRANDGWNKFGEISFVYDKDSIDPKRNRKNKIYGADAWTPTFPAIEYEIDNKVVNNAYDEVARIAKGMIPDKQYGEVLNRIRSMGEKLSRSSVEDVAQDAWYSNNLSMKAAYVASKGIKVEDVQKSTAPEFASDQIAGYNQLRDELGDNFDDLLELSSFEVRNKYGDALERAYYKIHENDEKKRPKLKEGFLRDRVLDNVAKNAVKYIYRDTDSGQTVQDTESIEKFVEANADREGFEKWIASLYDGAVIGSGISNGKDRYFSDGRRRSWKQTHVPVTAENILKSMMRENKTGSEAIFSTNSFIAVAQDSFKSIADVKRNEGRLQELDDSEFSAATQAIGEKLIDIEKEIINQNENNQLIAMDQAGEAITEAIRNHRTVEGIDKELRKWGDLNIREDTAQKILNLSKEAASLPTKYFEAKPERVVGFDEVRAAIVPADVAPEIKEWLNKQGINTVTYERDNDADRTRALNSVENVRFSSRDSQGKELTENQQKYFADSKVRDKDGNLKVMYHGTERGGFTVFNPAESDDGISLFFTDYSENAREYSGSYDEITPDRRMSESELFDMIENITEGDFQLSRTADGYAIEEYTLDNEGEFTYKPKKSFKTLKEAQAYAYEEFVKEGRKGGYGTIPGNYAVYLNLQNPLVVDAQDSSWREIPYWENDDGELEPATTREIAEDAKEQGYDGVIINNVWDNGQYAERQGVEANIAIAFSSNQVKSVYNENPTENNDIRYSSRMQELDAEYQEALDARNEDWQLMLVDQAAYNAGYTVGVYHGSPFENIRTFNTRSQDTKKQAKQLLFGTHFTHNLEYAKIYARKAKNSKGTSRMTTKTGQIYKTYLDLGKSLDLRTARNITPGTEEYKLYEDAPAKYQKKFKPHTFSKYDTEQGLGSGQYITASTIEDVLQAMSPKEATDFLVDHGYNSILYDASYATPTSGNNRFTRDPSIIMLDPERIKSGDPVTRDDSGNIIPLSERFNPANEDIRFSARNSTPAPAFYSKLQREIEGFKGNKIGAASVESYLKGKGVKDEEIKWSGIRTYLEGKKSVDKAELLQYLRENELQIEQTVTGGDSGYVDESTGKKFASAKAILDYVENELGYKNYSEDYDDYMGRFSVWIDNGTDDGIELNFEKTDADTNWGEYRLNGGDNYREILFRIPNSNYSNDAMQTHWGESGVLAHARVQDFETDDGDKVLFVEEIQSDWHNAGQKAGYSQDLIDSKGTRVINEIRTSNAFDTIAKQIAQNKLGDTSVKSVSWAKKRISELFRQYAETDSSALEEKISKEAGVKRLNRDQADIVMEYNSYLMDAIGTDYAAPDAPFRTTYTDYVLKNLLRMAAEGDYDYLAWTTGKMQEERWSDQYAEGYRIEYDQQIPKFLKKYGKQWGAGLTTITIESDNGDEVPAISVNELMKQSVLTEGQPRFSARDNGFGRNASFGTVEELERRNENIREMNYGLDAVLQNRGTQTRKLSDQQIERIARRFLREYGSKADVETITNGLKSMYEYIDNQAKISAQQVGKIANSFAEQILDGSKEVDDTMARMYPELAADIKRTKLYVSPETMKEMAYYFENAADFRRQARKYVTISEQRESDTRDIDTFYEELKDNYPELFDGETVNEKDQLLQIMNVAEQLKKKTVNKDWGSEYDEIAYTLGQDMVAAYFAEKGDGTHKRNIDIIKAQMKAEHRKEVENLRLAKDKQIQEIKKKLEDVRKSNTAKAIRAEYREKTEGLRRAKDRQVREVKEKLIDEKMKNIAKIAELRAKLNEQFRQRQEKAELRRLTTQAKARLQKNARNLWSKRGTPEFEKLKAKLFSELDLVSVGISRAGVLNLEKTYNDAVRQAALDPDYAASDEYKNIELKFRGGKDIPSIERKKLRDLSYEEIVSLTEDILALKHSQQTYNRLMKDNFKATVAEYGRKGVAQQNIVTGILNQNGFRANALAAVKKYALYMENPVRAAHLLDGYQKDGVLTELFDDINNGTTKKTRFQQKTHEMFEEVLNDKELMDGWSDQNIEIEVRGQKYHISKGMRIAIALHAQNTDNIRHIENGGFNIPNERYYKQGRYTDAYNSGTRVWMSKEDMDRIAAGMTEGEKRFAQIAHNFFNKTAKDAINETSLILKGYELAVVPNYFPIRTDKNFTQAEIDGLIHDGTIEGKGQFKDRQPGAKNPILLEDVALVIDRQTQTTGAYYGIAIPVRDMNKVWNYTATAYAASMKDSIGRNWGELGKQTIEKTLTDIQAGARRGDTGDHIFSFLKGAYAASTLVANAGVSIKQAASYPLAISMIDADCLAKGLTMKTDRAYMDSITPWSWDRRHGMGGEEMSDILKQKGMIARNQAAQNVKNFFNWIQAIDVLTTDHLFSACEAQIQKDHPKLEVRGEEYNKKVAELYNEMLWRTQPSYGVMQRNELMRSSSSLMKALTMFKTQTFNMGGEILDAALRAQAMNEMSKNGLVSKAEAKRAAKALGRVMWATVLSQATLAAMTALANAVLRKMRPYRDDKGEVTGASVARKVGTDFLTSWFGLFFGADLAEQGIAAVLNFAQWYDITAPQFDRLNDTVSDLSAWTRALMDRASETDESKKAEANAKVIKTTAKVAISATGAIGIPAQNIYNMLNAVNLLLQDTSKDGSGFLSFEAGSGLLGLTDTAPTKEQYARQAVYYSERDDSEKVAHALQGTNKSNLEKVLGSKLSKNLYESFLADPENLAKYMNVKQYGNTPRLTDVPDEGYTSFTKLREAIGDPERTQNWHHIVEQEQGPGDGNFGNFKATQINNKNNIVSIPSGAKSPHTAISKYYDSVQDFTDGKTVREWLSTKSFEEQFDFGVKQLQKYGDIIPTSNGWVFVPDEQKIEAAMPLEKGTPDVRTEVQKQWETRMAELREDGGLTGREVRDAALTMIRDGITADEALELYRQNQKSDKMVGKWKGSFEDYLNGRNAIDDAKAIKDSDKKRQKEKRKEAVEDYLRQYHGTKEDELLLWELMGYGKSTFDFDKYK